MNVDIAIVGSGLVGSSLAIALQDSDKDIVLIDAKPLQPLDASKSRPISLNHTSVNIFKNLGIWPSLAAHATAIKQVHVSEKGAFSAVRIKASDYQLDALGQVVPLHLLYNALIERLQQQSNLQLKIPNRVLAAQEEDNGICLQLDDDSHIQAKLVIAADGTQSTLRELLSIRVKSEASKEQAIIATLTAEHQHIAYERFCSDGIIALLPQANNRCGLVWTSDDAERLLQLDDEAFLNLLQEHMGYKVGVLSHISKRLLQPLNLTIAEQQVRPHCVLLGNAAHTFYPVAAQGFNLSLSDMAHLLDIINDDRPLSDYEQSRQQQQQATTFFTQFLADIFTTDNPLSQLGRRCSLTAISKMPFLKQKLANFAMGRVGKSPKLALCEDIS